MRPIRHTPKAFKNPDFLKKSGFWAVFDLFDIQLRSNYFLLVWKMLDMSDRSLAIGVRSLL
ncbi:MAG: hypothetical protein F6K14_15250 [Symploca sp. SIO2C1]|nr:hypothetical protein [Symploca sp. SIO2C1]